MEGKIELQQSSLKTIPSDCSVHANVEHMIQTSIFCFIRFRHLIPITFLTGFYVSEVVKRYWDQFMNLPYPDRLALKLITYVPGKVY